MQRIFVICLILAVILTACVSTPAPEPTADVVATSQVISATMVAATLTAFQPSATLLPTDTLTPFATQTLTGTPGPTRTRVPKATKEPTYSGCYTPTGVSKLEAPFKIENLSKTKISVFINGMTSRGEHPIYCSYTLSKGADVLFTIWWGKYTYMVQIKGRTTFQGSFFVNDVDKATMRVTETGIQLGPFP